MIKIIQIKKFYSNNLLEILLSLSSSQFLILLSLIITLLYFNTINSSYVWDDRAAIIDNGDVTGVNSFFSLFSHDFWGQPIHLEDSHKSYRPITIISLRLNFLLFNIKSSYFLHIGNLIIYFITCFLFYFFALYFLSIPGNFFVLNLFFFFFSNLFLPLLCYLILFILCSFKDCCHTLHNPSYAC